MLPYIIGGVALTALIFIALLRIHSAKSSTTSNSMQDILADVADEQLVVEEVNIADLLPWFKTRISDTCICVIIHPSETNITKFKIPQSIELNGDNNNIIQVIYDEKADAIKSCRVVSFEKIGSKLSALLNENDGVLVIEQ